MKKARKETIVGLLAVVIWLLTYLGPIPGNMTRELYMVFGTVIIAIMTWVGIGVTWPNFFIIFTVISNPAFSNADVAKATFGNTTPFFLIVAFAIVGALNATGVTKRIALAIISSKAARKSAWWTVFMVLLANYALCQTMAAVNILTIGYAIVNEVCEMAGYKRGDETPKMLMHGTCYVGMIAAAMTPIGHNMVMNALTFFSNYTSTTIDFFDWCLVGVPVGLVLTAGIFLFIRFIWKPDVSMLKNVDFDAIRAQIGPMTRTQKSFLIVYAAVVLAWVLPGFFKYIPALAFMSKLPNTIPPIIGMVILALLRDEEGNSMFNYKQTVAKYIPWNVIIFNATLCALSSIVSNKDIGFSAWVADTVGVVFIGMSPILLVCLMICICGALTQLISNSVAISLTFALGLPIILGNFMDTVSVTGLCVVMTLIVNCGYATPSACSANAMALNYDWLDTPTMWKRGWQAYIVLAILACAIGYPIASAIAGLGL